MTWSSGTVPTIWAGLPATIARSGTSRVTTDPAATNAFWPMVTPGSSTLAPPTRAARRIRGAAGMNLSEGRRYEIARSFMVVTRGPQNTSSSIATPRVM